MQISTLSLLQEGFVIDALISSDPSTQPIDSAVKTIGNALGCETKIALRVLRRLTERELLEIRPQPHVDGRLSANAPVKRSNWKWHRVELEADWD